MFPLPLKSPMPKPKPRRRYGFTVVEILLVIALNAAFTALLFPVFQKVRENSRNKTCQSNLKQIGVGILQYASEADGTYPNGTSSDWAGNWATTLQPYLSSPNVFYCPDDLDHVMGNPSFSPTDTQYNWMFGNGISYAGNSVIKYRNGPRFYGNYLAGVFGYPQGWVVHNTCTLAEVTQPAATIIVAEKHNTEVKAFNGGLGGVSSKWGPSDLFMNLDINSSSFGPQLAPDSSRPAAAYPKGPNGAVSSIHAGLSNFLFADGHVKSMLPSATNPTGSDKTNMWIASR